MVKPKDAICCNTINTTATMTWHILITPCDSGLAQQFRKHDTVLYFVPGICGEDMGTHCSASAAMSLWEAGTLCTAVPVVQMGKQRPQAEVCQSPQESLTKPKRQPESPNCNGPA